MRRLVGTEAGLVVTFAAGVLVAYVGLALTVSGPDRLVGALVLLVGLWAASTAPVVHDQLHVERGEQRHARWTRGDWRNLWWRR